MKLIVAHEASAQTTIRQENDSEKPDMLCFILSLYFNFISR